MTAIAALRVASSRTSKGSAVGRRSTAHHRLDELVREGIAKGFPQLGPVRVGVAGGRTDHVMAGGRLTDPWQPFAVALHGRSG
jgi:hypothetical protein